MLEVTRVCPLAQASRPIHDGSQAVLQVVSCPESSELEVSSLNRSMALL